VMIEYKIHFEAGGVKITQRVDTGASSGSASSQSTENPLTLLGNSLRASKAAATARAAGRGGGAVDPLGSGSGAADPLGSGSGAVDPLGSGSGAVDPLGSGSGSAGQGQAVVFGPLVIDATGMIHRYLTEQAPKEKHGEK
jgi:hypothetical protein